MDIFTWLAAQSPLIILFSTIAVGYLVGKFKVGTFVLGGIAGTLLVGVVFGQFGVSIDSGIKSIFFALFIYAVGYQGGPQFFRALSLKSLNQLISASLMCVVGLATVLAFAWLFNLDRGTAAGLAAGGLTQSAIIGTAGETIQKLNISSDLKQIMETNIAVGYAVCYIFGSLGPIIMITWFFPTIMKWDIRAEALKLAEEMSGGSGALEPGQFNAASRIDTRFFKLLPQSQWIGKSAKALDDSLDTLALEAVLRNGKEVDHAGAVPLQASDIVAVTGLVSALETYEEALGQETTPPQNYRLVLENRHLVITSNRFHESKLSSIHDHTNKNALKDVFVTGVRRMGRSLPLLGSLQLHKGDEIQLTGSPADLNKVQGSIGYPITAAAVTDFIFFGLGMTLGLLIGLIEFRIAGVPVTIGSGGGCLLSGLLFGWLRSTHPRYAALPTGATNFLRDFGLAVFVGVVGITAGPQVLTTLKEQGLNLFLFGVGVTLIPQVIVFFFSYYVLKIRNPIEALACVAGGRSANPGFAALLAKAGNATPVVTFTVTYAVANVLLTLWGPLIVGLVTTNPLPLNP
ncbi:aspartate-alanine antiporter [Roseibium hamelinense]|uniref:Aspartate-alanine antiporter n=1 Tax=Roseibium hamelinense TaxID=150831 RepID=A0A562T3J8_9HYPH|nr:aspartate-alanine antiporter [Roseibium hamelinense]MTI44492.1 aspartate-alanine antiporter [Roseibium hamelinense]TWI87460.1 aspartate-alanine antiporter [Roseibium hamelinense]